MNRTTKKTYRVTDWAKYNEFLVQRGDITFLFSAETLQQWEHPNDQVKEGERLFAATRQSRQCWCCGSCFSCPTAKPKIKEHGNSPKEPLVRDEAIRAIRKRGRKKWKEENGYHTRSLGETAMFRHKNAFGDKLKNQLPADQKTEATVRSKILNQFPPIGMPEFEWS